MAIPPLSTGAGQTPGLGRQGPDAAAAARAEAQRAFFQAALGRTQAASATAPVTRQPSQPAGQTAHASTPPEAPAAQRLPRPGSLVNIVV